VLNKQRSAGRAWIKGFPKRAGGSNFWQKNCKFLQYFQIKNTYIKLWAPGFTINTYISLWAPGFTINTYINLWAPGFTINSNKSSTQCNNFSVYNPDVCLQLNMFRAFSRPSSGTQWLQWQPLVLPSCRGDSRAVIVVGPADPTTNTARLSS
jgi:hypothetical protein